MYRTYKFKLEPNPYQKVKIDFTLKCVNKVRELCIKNKDLKRAKDNSKKLLDEYLEKDDDLKKCDYSALINALFQITDERNPRKIGKHYSYTTTYSDFLRQNFPIKNNRICLSRVGYVRFRRSRETPPESAIAKLIVRKDLLGDYYVYIVFSTMTKTAKGILNPELSVGLDYSSTNFIVDSDGKKYGIPKFYREIEWKVKAKKRELNLKEKGSRRYQNKKKEIARLYMHSANKRRDYLHKLSSELSEKYDYIFVEDLDLKRMAKYHNLSKATMDNSYGMFLEQLEYKMENKGKKLIKISRWFPSSKKCSSCGFIKKDLDLKTRNWTCPVCNTIHDRDVNAAKNIKTEGKKTIKMSLGERHAIDA